MVDEAAHPHVQALDRLVIAVESSDADALRAAFAPDAIIWQGHDGTEHSVQDISARLAGPAPALVDRAYVDRHVFVFANGVAQSHTLRATRRETGERVEMHAVLVCTVVDGLISRLEEYLDPAALSAP